MVKQDAIPPVPELKFDTPEQVHQQHFHILQRVGAGVVAFRQEDGKYFVRFWGMKHDRAIFLRHLKPIK